MDLEHLRYFASVARLEHVGRAAEELERSEAAISRSITRLESYYGTAFFEREGRGIRLTDHGRLFLGVVERTLADLDGFEAMFGRKQVGQDSPISLGFFATLGTRVVPHLVRLFQESFPTARFLLFQGPAPVLQRRLLASEVDLCLVSPRFEHRELDWEPLWSEELVLCVPAAHSLANAKCAVALADCASELFVAMRPMFGLRRDLERLCAQGGFTPRVVCEGEEVGTVRGLVSEGLGIAVLPRLSSGEIEGVVEIPISRPAARRTFGLAWRRADRLSGANSAFREFVRSQSAVLQAFTSYFGPAEASLKPVDPAQAASVSAPDRFEESRPSASTVDR